MSFSDIFKKSFLQGYSTIELSTKGIIVALCFSLALGLYIFFCYRLLTRRTFYSKNFNISLVCMSLITTAIILTIQSSVVVSLGMVGALSIVRFRTAIKEPMDLVFLYWAISVGIICGAGLSEIAIIMSLVVTVAVFVLGRIPLGKAPMILVVNSENDKETNKAIRQAIRRNSKFFTEKSRNITGSQLNLVVELSVKDGSALTSELSSLRTIHSVSLLSHDGEVTF